MAYTLGARKALLTRPAAAAAGSSTDPYVMAQQEFGSGATTQNLTLTQGASAGALVVLFVQSPGSALSSVGDTVGGNTYSGGTQIISNSQRLHILRSTLVNALPAGASITLNYGGSVAPKAIAVCFPLATGFSHTNNAGATGTSTTPTLTTVNPLASQPQYVVFGIYSNGGIDDIDTATGWPAGFAVLGDAETAGVGIRLYQQRVTSTSAVTFAPTGHANVAWGLQCITMTTT